MSSYNSIARSRQDPETPNRPSLGTRGTWPFQIEDDHPRLKPGTITYINSPHRWFLVTFDDDRRQGYHFGEV
nr:MAG TPA: hypothetical protein [Caudoviricetes sp.]